MRWNPLRPKQYLTIAAASAAFACGQIPGLGGDGGSTPVEPKWSSLYSSYLQNCKSCHAPNAPGHATSDTFTVLDFSTASTAFNSVTKNADGLQDTFAACNGVPFVVSGHPEQSLLVAALDQPTRQSFTSGGCTGDTISDQPVKMSGTPMPDGFSDALKTWITNGAQNN
jgi:hypothetical protein